jgi:hypothetical protein
LASLTGGFIKVFGEIQHRIGWRGRSEDDRQSFVVIEHDLRLCLQSTRSRTAERLSAS